MKYPVQTYILARTWIYYRCILLVYYMFHQTMKSILNVKKASKLIKVISSYNICKKLSTRKKKVCHSVPKTFDFSQNSSVPFHQVTFDHSISCVLLIDKPNESCQNFKKFKRNAISTTKKAFKKKRK